jgi:hypothetical protein
MNNATVSFKIIITATLLSLSVCHGTSIRHMAGVIGISGLAGYCLWSFFDGTLVEKKISYTAQNTKGGVIILNNSNGDIDIDYDGSAEFITVFMHLKAATQKKLDVLEERAMPCFDQNGFHIDNGTCNEKDQCNISITIPRSQAAQWKIATVQSVNGKVNVIPMPFAHYDSSISMKTTNGTINVQASEENRESMNDTVALHLETSNGAVYINGVPVAVHIRTSNGKVKVVDGPKTLSIVTTNGSIDVDGCDEETNIKALQTTNGSIYITTKNETKINAASLAHIHTTNGAIFINGKKVSGKK